MNAPMLWPGVLTRLMACPPTCGAAAALLVSEAYALKHGLDHSVRIRAQSMTTDSPRTFEAHDMREVVGFSMAQDAARQVYEQAGISPQDVDVVELHDCFAQNELLTYEALGLCPVGGAEKFVCDGDNTYGGKVVTNPSGGLLSKGHPLGATGAMILGTLIDELHRRHLRYGLATLCVGGGMGIATIIASGVLISAVSRRPAPALESD